MNILRDFQGAIRGFHGSTKDKSHGTEAACCCRDERELTQLFDLVVSENFDGAWSLWAGLTWKALSVVPNPLVQVLKAKVSPKTKSLYADLGVNETWRRIRSSEIDEEIRQHVKAMGLLQNERDLLLADSSYASARVKFQGS